ncbi:hypothetical protein C8Q72DRAFT_613532 [Fomitopsis betulina]|nr:hypothetical protein C8Q72DRAFT_613532 [Fomitopsis betulina]
MRRCVRTGVPARLVLYCPRVLHALWAAILGSVRRSSAYTPGVNGARASPRWSGAGTVSTSQGTVTGPGMHMRVHSDRSFRRFFYGSSTHGTQQPREDARRRQHVTMAP